MRKDRVFPMLLLANSEAWPGFPTSVQLLKDGAVGLDALVAGISLVEREARVRSVGFGGWPNMLGQMEFDAGVMDGTTREVGAVGAVPDTLPVADLAHEVMKRLPELAPALEPLVAELRDARTCLVHGDYAPKNILLGADGAWVLDAEVAHYGHPVFDLAFFLAFPLLTALEQPGLAGACSELVRGFADAYASRAKALSPPASSLVAHTGAMLLARTDGRSPATFLGARATGQARALGRRLLLEPTTDLAGVVASCG
jgi:hypothetical protein